MLTPTSTLMLAYTDAREGKYAQAALEVAFLVPWWKVAEKAASCVRIETNAASQAGKTVVQGAKNEFKVFYEVSKEAAERFSKLKPQERVAILKKAKEAKTADEVAAIINEGYKAAAKSTKPLVKRARVAADPGKSVSSGYADYTYASGIRGGRPTGARTVNKANANSFYKRGIQRENEAASALAREGYRVEQNPPSLPSGKNPDFRIEGRYFDCYAPTTDSASNIVKHINNEKLAQADRIVLNLADSNVTRHELREALKYASPDLKEIILIERDGSICHFYP